MNLTEKPEAMDWPVTHFVFIEKIGSLQEAGKKAWDELLQHLNEISNDNVISGFMSLYKIEPQMIYRAGTIVDSKPEKLPPGLGYMKFEGGRYSRFVLTGPYSNIPEACERVASIIDKLKIKHREDFYIEHYLNDPRTTPEDQLITELLIPTHQVVESQYETEATF